MRHMIAEPESDKKLQRKDCFEKFCFAKYMTEKILKLFKSKYMNIKINTDCQNAEHIKIYIYISGGPLSALTCCVNVKLLSAIKKISPLIYSQSWVRSWVYTTQAMMSFALIF